MTNFDEEIVSSFLEEAADVLVEWERTCLDLEKNPRANVGNALFRSSHNLKGASFAVGLGAFGAFVHEIENVISSIVGAEEPISSEIVSLLLDCHAVLSEWIEGLKKNLGFQPETEKIIARLQSAIVVPNFDKSESETRDILVSSAIPDSENTPLAQEELDSIFGEAKRQVDREKIRFSKDTKISFFNEGDDEQELVTTEMKSSKKAETLRINAFKLDEIIQLIGELSIHQTIIYQANRSGNLETQDVQNAIHFSNRITKDLHSMALSLRMYPLEKLFQRLERVARDVACSVGKNILVEVEGASVELDRSVIEKIADPLIHIVRNAVDHGIESVAERRNSGKTEVGTLKISASQDSGGVCIQISDDGCGLDPELLMERAIQKGFVSTEKTLAEDKLYRLIFEPGFTTADEATEFSGRGVGLDVVMETVETLRGSIDLKNNKGGGIEFVIFLPTSLSILEALVVDVDQIKYAVPMQELLEIIDLSNYDVETTGDRGRMISLRGNVIPLEPLFSYLPTEQERHSQSISSGTSPALVVRDGGNLIAFEVDQILSQQQVVVRQLSRQLSKLKGLGGCTILEDGEPGMILSLPELAKSYFESTRSLGSDV